MYKSLKRAQQGFTIIELLIVIAILAILTGLIMNNLRSAQAKKRDNHRVADISALQRELEEFYNENGYYPSTVPTDNKVKQLLPGIDAEVVKDPKGHTIVSATASDADAAKAAADKAINASDHNYAYVAYPANCTTETNDCTGYILHSFIEKPSAATPNPYEKVGLNNN